MVLGLDPTAHQAMTLSASVILGFADPLSRRLEQEK
jgi:hypothetical protein